jgi:hypothetical protein
MLAMAGCLPQARYFNVDVRSEEFVEIPIEGNSVAVFSIVSQNRHDSIRCSNVALGLAEKIEADRGLEKGDVAVYSIPKIEFRGFPSALNDKITDVDTVYLSQLMLKTGVQMFVFVDNLRFGQYSIPYSVTSADFDNTNVLVPYMVDMNVFDPVKGETLYKLELRDSIYMQMVSSVVTDKKVGAMISNYLPEISGKIGQRLASSLSVQWETQERMLVSFSDVKWEKACDLAQDFKWEEAIKIWMGLAESENPKKAAYAAYNIAVGCEMLEQFELSRKWIEFSLKKYKFKEALLMNEYIKKRTGSL